MHEYLSGCYCAIGSMTQAMRAQRVLGDAAIRAEIVKADPASAGRGCAYALSYSCAQANNVQTILTRSGIRPHSYYGGGNV